MKKTITTFILAFFVFTSLRAQEGEIIYIDYGMNGLTHEFAGEVFDLYEYYSWYLDLDQNGTNDFHYNAYIEYYGPETWGCSNWVTLSFQTALTPEFPLPNVASDLQIGDTISNSDVVWRGGYCPPLSYGLNAGHRYLAFRMVKDEDLYYGWIEQDVRYVDTPVVVYYGTDCLNKAVVSVRQVAYCTIPNYPLRLGQTSFDWDVAENEANYFASIHPNPTTGQVTITGKDLKQAEVFNTLGQHVATAQGECERLTVDISALPAGIYFVNVTDEDGKKCVRKVVKQ